jgi:predicted acetyltransferase
MCAESLAGVCQAVPMPSDHIDIRATRPDEQRKAADTMRAALLSQPTSDSEWEKSAPSWDDQISYTAWDDHRCVGHVGAFRFDTVVPGGRRLPTAGVTRVGVLPTHTRRGLLSKLMGELLIAARAEGRPLASLRASEATIYRRFGFGVAADSYSMRLTPCTARPIHGAAAGSVRLLGRDEIMSVVPPLYERVATRPGVVSRADHFHRRYMEDALGTDKAGFVVVHSSVDGVDDGFAHYTVKWSEPGDSGGKGEVHDLWGDTPAAELALWDYLVNIDLVRSYEVHERPLDDPLRHAVADRRALQVTERFDEQWTRLLDVKQCLSARTYRSPQQVSITVSDVMFPDNNGVYAISADGVRREAAGAAAADLSADVDVLGAAYMGAVSWNELAAAGRVDGSAEAVARADDLFAHRPLAWCGSFF